MQENLYLLIVNLIAFFCGLVVIVLRRPTWLCLLVPAMILAIGRILQQSSDELDLVPGNAVLYWTNVAVSVVTGVTTGVILGRFKGFPPLRQISFGTSLAFLNLFIQHT